MPIPTPIETESEREFINRCMGDETMVQDFEDNGQRYAICLRQYNEKADPMPEDCTDANEGGDGMNHEDMVMIPMAMLVELILNQKPKE